MLELLLWVLDRPPLHPHLCNVSIIAKCEELLYAIQLAGLREEVIGDPAPSVHQQCIKLAAHCQRADVLLQEGHRV